MGAWGHDVHGTWTYGAAALLSATPAAGDVLVVLQPAEEVGEGASAVLESGALDDARVIFGAHVDRRFTVGQGVAQGGAPAAVAGTLEVGVRCAGVPGARPHPIAHPILCKV